MPSVLKSDAKKDRENPELFSDFAVYCGVDRNNGGQPMSKKLREAMLFFINMQDEISFLGRTKLAKLLFFADFEFYSENHSSITGTMYMKKEHGPFPVDCTFYDALDCLEQDGSIEIRTVTTGNFDRDEYVPTRKADVSCFTEDEIETLTKVGMRFKNYNAKQIKDFSHGTPAYVLTGDDETIGYELSYY